MLDQDRVRIRNYEAGAAMAPHQHSEASLSIVVRGGFLEAIGPATREYARGHVAFLPGGVTHSQTFGASGARQVTIRPEPAWVDYLADSKVAIGLVPHTRATAFAQLGDRLQAELQMGDDLADLACQGLVLELVAAFGRACAPRAAPNPPPWVKAARDYIHENALQPLRLADIAAVAGRHEIHLAREFRRHFGLSVGDYVRGLRIDHAATLIRRALPLSEVALECGFSSHAHLCREFKRRFGATPSQYRQL